MCCRYFLDESPELRPIVEAMNRSPLLEPFQRQGKIVSAGEVRPGDIVPVIAPNKGGRRAVFPMQWGFPAHTLLINARLETAAVRPAFREAWARRRCMIPASCYFEWEHLILPDGKKKTGPKYSLRPEGQTLSWLCGLYRLDQGLPRFVVLTREPGDVIRFIHDRMPLLLPEACLDEWIRPDADPEKLLSAAQTDLVFEPVA